VYTPGNREHGLKDHSVPTEKEILNLTIIDNAYQSGINTLTAANIRSKLNKIDFMRLFATCIQAIISVWIPWLKYSCLILSECSRRFKITFAERTFASCGTTFSCWRTYASALSLVVTATHNNQETLAMLRGWNKVILISSNLRDECCIMKVFFVCSSQWSLFIYGYV